MLMFLKAIADTNTFIELYLHIYIPTMKCTNYYTNYAETAQGTFSLNPRSSKLKLPSTKIQLEKEIQYLNRREYVLCHNVRGTKTVVIVKALNVMFYYLTC